MVYTSSPSDLTVDAMYSKIPESYRLALILRGGTDTDGLKEVQAIDDQFEAEQTAVLSMSVNEKDKFTTKKLFQVCEHMI